MYDTWRTQLIQGMALVEALIDFGEDENIEDDVYDNGKMSHCCFSFLFLVSFINFFDVNSRSKGPVPTQRNPESYG